MKTFGELERSEQIALFEAWLDGKEIEVPNYSFPRAWILIEDPSWSKREIYRIKPTKPSINWDHVSKEYKYLVSGDDGDAYLYRQRPVICMEGWELHGDEGFCSSFSSFKPGTCDWTDSLVERPEEWG